MKSFACLIAVLAVACTGAEPARDGEHDRFVASGKADTGGIEEGTNEALGVLYLANSASLDELMDDVGLSELAATNITAYRAGDDETLGTEDDESFETLAELDSIPFIGPNAFDAMLSFAVTNGYTDDPPAIVIADDPFNPESCQGAPLSYAAAENLADVMGNTLGSYQMSFRSRECDGDDCKAWESTPLSGISWATKASGLAKLLYFDGILKLQLRNSLCEHESSYSSAQYNVGTTCTGIGAELTCGAYHRPSICSGDGGNYEYDKTAVVFHGVLTENCLQLISHRTYFSTYTFNDYEREVAVLVRF